MNIKQPVNRNEILECLRGHGIIDNDEHPTFRELEGGVSSDIWFCETRRGKICVKRALSRLKTEMEWHAPVTRNASEAEWIRVAGKIVPGAVPRLLAEDHDIGLFVMEYFDPATHKVWKNQLRDGTVSPDTAAMVGAALGTIHAATTNNPVVKRRFATDGIFQDIRIEPYLLRTARAHPDLASKLQTLAQQTLATRRVLVHGDVSPKNILVGPDGPVFLDAECAWFGEPAFDLAFCLNHLLLKCIWRPRWTGSYLDCYAALAESYFGHVDWESPSQLEKRAAALLPGLMLARVDGASPVEYVTEAADKERVRLIARRALETPCDTLALFCRQFRLEL